MADWPLTGGTRQEKLGLLGGANTTHVIIANPAGAHVKGAWTQLVAATAFHASALLLEIGPLRSGQSFLIDVAIGAAGSETIIVADLLAAAGFTDNVVSHLLLPIPVPAGTRLSARSQGSLANGGRIGVRAIAGDFQGVPTLGRCVTYGADAATSLGTPVEPDTGTANTKGAWVELAAATSDRIRYLGMTLSHGSGTPGATQAHQLDVAIGAAGSETIIIPDLMFVTQANARLTTPQAVGLPITIPQGSRIAVRQQSSSIINPGRTLYVCLHGVS